MKTLLLFVFIIACLPYILFAQENDKQQESGASEIFSIQRIKKYTNSAFTKVKVWDSEKGKYVEKTIRLNYGLKTTEPKEKGDTIVFKFPLITDKFYINEDSTLYAYLDFSQTIDSLYRQISYAVETRKKDGNNSTLKKHNIYYTGDDTNSITLPAQTYLRMQLDAEKAWLYDTAVYINSVHNKPGGADKSSSHIIFTKQLDNKLTVKRSSWIVGAGTIPLKIRFRQDTIPTVGKADVNINIYTGYKYAQTKYRGASRSEWAVAFVGFAGISAESISKSNTAPQVTQDYTIPVLNYGVGFQAGWRNIFMGLVLGFDAALDKDGREKWIYNNVPYLGVALGYKLPIFK